MTKNELVISQVIEIKKSIADFMVTLADYANKNDCLHITQQQKSFFAFISKQIIFLKEIYERKHDYNLKVLISDYYNYIVSIIKNETRYIYVNERSIIENYVRWLTYIDIEEDYITNNSFIKLKEKKDILKLTDAEFSLIKNEYTVSCGYIHGSKLLNDNLTYVFCQCISNTGQLKNQNNYFKNIINMIKLFNKMVVCMYYELLDITFFRRKSVLKYLIGDKLVDMIFSYR